MLVNNMELRMGSGLTPVKEHEADVIVLAGMGGILITELIQESINVAKKANCILIQPMTHQELIRPFLWENGFEIIDESLTCEGKKLYLVILTRYTGIRCENRERIRDLIGDILIKKRSVIKGLGKRPYKETKKAVNGLKSAKVMYNAEKIDMEEKLLKELTILLNSLGGE